MVKKIAIAVGLLAAVLALMGWAGFRLERGGSGWPRYMARSNDDRLEQDRARQRAAAVSPAPAHASSGLATSDAAAAPAPTITSMPAGAPAEQPPASAPGATRPAREWTDFRGPRRDGRYTATPILTTWPGGGLPQRWKQPVGAGYASFVAADGRAFTIEQRRTQEVVAAYDTRTGRELWTHGWNAYFRESMGGDGPRATPTYHDGRVYALGAEGELRVIDAAKGVLIWRRNILADARASNIPWGMSASPLIVDDTVVTMPGGSRGHSFIAYNRATGEPVWHVLDDEASYTSPMLVTLGGVRQILGVTATRAVGLAPEDGRLLWEYPWSTFNGINVSQPILFQHQGADRVFLSASYGHGAAVFELTRHDDRFQTRTIWENQRMKNKFTSSVLHNGHIYGLDESILACIDANTGEQRWKGGRYGYGQIMLAGDHIIVLTEDGNVALVNATPERHEEVASFPAIEGKTWNHPIIADGLLLVRNIQEMAAFAIAQ